jgi:hypothetical protein
MNCPYCSIYCINSSCLGSICEYYPKTKTNTITTSSTCYTCSQKPLTKEDIKQVLKEVLKDRLTGADIRQIVREELIKVHTESNACLYAAILNAAGGKKDGTPFQPEDFLERSLEDRIESLKEKLVELGKKMEDRRECAEKWRDLVGNCNGSKN